MTEFSTRASVDRVWEAADRLGLQPTKRSNDFHIVCPLHGDRTPSLHVTWKPDDEGFTLLHCFGCQASQRDLAEALGLTLSDLFDNPRPFSPDKSWIVNRKSSTRRRPKLDPLPARNTLPAKSRTPLQFDETAVYSYCDLDGAVVQQVVREEAQTPDGKEKRFTQRFMNTSTGKFVKRKPEGFQPVVYNWPAVAEAIQEDRPVWIVEGEKDADTAVAHGLVATTNAQGGGNFPAELGALFTGADVVVVVDRDQAGYQRGHDLAQLLGEHSARSVTLYVPATAAAKSDLTDHFEAGFGVADFVQATFEEMRVWAMTESVKALTGKVIECEKEIGATLRSGKSGQNPTVAQLKDSARWAEESYLRWIKVAEAARDTLMTASTVASPSARDAEEIVTTSLAQAGDMARLCHAAAHIKLPKELEETPAPAPRPIVVGMSPAAADDDQESDNPPAIPGHTIIAGDDGRPNIGSTYIVRNGETVQVKYVKDGEEYVPRFHTVIHGWAEIDQILVADNGHEDGTTPADTKWIGNFFRWAREDDGTIKRDENSRPKIESEPFAWGPDELKNGNWVNNLPWPGLLESTTSRGKDTAVQALLRAKPAPTQRTPIYTATGWRTADTGDFFVHADGALAKHGNISVQTELPAPFRVYRFTEPCTEAMALRDAFEEGTAPLLDLPARIVAPLLGTVWRSFMKSVRVVTHLAGGAGTGKTALGRAVMHYAAPTLSYLGSDRDILSGSNKGGTALGLMRALESLSYLPVLIDDFTPDGDLKKAQQKLDELARAHYNASGRVVSTREGGVKSSRPSLATLITTAEFTASGSAGTRTLTLALNAGDIPNTGQVFQQIERPNRRQARNIVGSTLVAWLAERRTKMLEAEETHLEDPDHPENLFAFWTKRAAALPHTEGAKGRMVEAAADASAGIRLMMSMLRDYGAATAEEAEQFIAWANEGIFEAIRSQDSSTGDAGEQLLFYLREAMSSQSGHLTDTEGGLPLDPIGCGWTRRGSGPEAIHLPMGAKIGIIKEDRVYLLPNVCIRIARQLAMGADISFSETSTTISSSFLAHGWITPDGSGARCVSRRINGVKQRVWDIPLSVLLGDDNGQDPLPMNPVNPFQPAPESPTRPMQPAPSQGPAEGDIPPAELPAAVAVDTRRQDAEGAVGITASLDSPRACIFCARPVHQTICGDPVCWPDWKSSTAETRAFALAAGSTAEAPVQPGSQQPGTAVMPSAEMPAQATTAPRGDYAFAAAVLDADGLWTPDGVLHELDPFPRHAGDVAKLAGDFNLGARITSYRSGSTTKWRTARGSIWLTYDAALKMGLPVDERSDMPALWRSEITKLTENHPTLTDAIADGWTVGGSKTAYTSWTRIYRGHEGAVIAMIPAMSPDMRDYPILSDAPTAGVLARRLQIFTNALGHPLLMGSSSTGMDLMFALPTKEHRQKYFQPSKLLEDVYAGRMPEIEINWSRKPNADESKMLYVHAYDRSGSYLAGTQSTILPIGEPVHHPEGTDFDAKTPGYWQIDVVDSEDWRLPNPVFPVQGQIPETIWVTTPTLALAIERGMSPTIHQAYTWEGGRILDSWADRLNRARTSLAESEDPEAALPLKQVKRVYTESIGMMVSDHLRKRNGEGYAPERRDTIIGRSKANLLRRVIANGERSGQWPVAIGTDSIVYVSNEADPIKAWPGQPEWLGTKLGRYHHVGSHLLSEHSKFLTGHGYNGGLEHLKSGIEIVLDHSRESA
ncbi:CHC2 zinc finger domain-containing protein [Paenarthrobacter nicotinovorans]|uniref:CHC2 zinc finger domain-containing protein n=1 Tax=Paenarthrobacter nicotinovorans TaxID=29320 RepID=UPI00119F6521|nr:CHC2 zinc finger domain-containing protein [Paenarthrobacter nicotinovorans]